MEPEYVMPGNSNYKKPKKLIQESADDRVKIKIAKKNTSFKEKQINDDMDRLPIIQSSYNKSNNLPLTPNIKNAN